MSGRVSTAADTLLVLVGIVAGIRAALPVAEEAAARIDASLGRLRAASVGVTSVAAIAEAGGVLCDVLRDIGREASAEQVEPVMLAAASGFGTVVPVSSSLAVTLSSDLARALAACVEAAVLAEASVAAASRGYGDRPSALAARARLAEVAGPALERIAQLAGEGVWRASSDSVRFALDHLSRAALDLKPVVRIAAARSFPATALAWRLYGDPERAAELVDRNRVSTPAFMPAEFEALSS